MKISERIKLLVNKTRQERLMLLYAWVQMDEINYTEFSNFIDWINDH